MAVLYYKPQLAERLSSFTTKGGTLNGSTGGGGTFHEQPSILLLPSSLQMEATTPDRTAAAAAAAAAAMCLCLFRCCRKFSKLPSRSRSSLDS